MPRKRKNSSIPKTNKRQKTNNNNNAKLSLDSKKNLSEEEFIFSDESNSDNEEDFIPSNESDNEDPQNAKETPSLNSAGKADETVKPPKKKEQINPSEKTNNKEPLKKNSLIKEDLSSSDESQIKYQTASKSPRINSAPKIAETIKPLNREKQLNPAKENKKTAEVKENKQPAPIFNFNLPAHLFNNNNNNNANPVVNAQQKSAGKKERSQRLIPLQQPKKTPPKSDDAYDQEINTSTDPILTATKTLVEKMGFNWAYLEKNHRIFNLSKIIRGVGPHKLTTDIVKKLLTAAQKNSIKLSPMMEKTLKNYAFNTFRQPNLITTSNNNQNESEITLIPQTTNDNPNTFWQHPLITSIPPQTINDNLNTSWQPNFITTSNNNQNEYEDFDNNNLPPLFNLEDI